MSSMTAQIAVGQEDRYHGGINPTHTLWLRENSRPSWWLIPTGWGLGGEPVDERDEKDKEDPRAWTREEVVWIPAAPEHILEDALLMVALHVVVDEECVEIALDHEEGLLDPGTFELGKWMLPEMRTALLKRLPEIRGYKLMVSVYDGSSLQAQLPLLARYPVKTEVCTLSYARLGTGMAGSGPLEERGDLAATPAAFGGAGGPQGHRYGDVNIW